MKLSEVQKILTENGIGYALSTEPNRADFYRRKGFRPTEDTHAFHMLNIANPHHGKHIEIVFADASEDPEFYDLGFGGYWYDMFGFLESELPQSLLDEIQKPKSLWRKLIGRTDAYEIFNWVNYEKVIK